MYIKTKISLNFLVMSLLMISTGAGYLFTSLYIEKKLEAVSETSLPSIQELNQLREGIWSLWYTREDPVRTEDAFRELEEQILNYRTFSSRDEAEGFALQLRTQLLEMQEGFNDREFEAFQNQAVELNKVVSNAMLKETLFLLKRSRDVNGILYYANFLGMLFVAVAILFCMLPGWWLASSISKALGNASRAADRIASGDLSDRLSEEGEDEISELAGAFNRMVDTIHQADEEITREVEERARAEQKAQTAAKAKSDFLAHMSHEFRTPLNGILGYSQLLSMDPGLSEKNREVVKSLRRSGESLLELINDVLDLTKIEAQKMNVKKARFYLDDFLDSLVESYAEQVKAKGLEFRIELDKNLPEDILSDQIRLRQILVNLLSNSIKFTDKGYVGLQINTLEGGIRFAVCDSGIGIAEEHHAAVMQPFQQVENRERINHGTGLGLAISNRLLEMMGTHLNLKSEEGEGTTFWFDLPQPEIKHRKLVQSHTHISGYHGRVRKILIGEHNLGIATLLMPLLQKVGFEVLHIRENEPFLEKCKIFQPDVVLIDLYFADDGGVEMVKKLETVYVSEAELTIPKVFMFSDHRSPVDRERALKAGADAYLGTPIRFAELLSLLHDELELNWVESADGEAGKDNQIQEKLEPQEEVLPGDEDLLKLLELSRSGNVRQLKVYLEKLKEDASELTPFVDRLLEHCSHYRINAILSELESLTLGLRNGETASSISETEK